VLWFLYIFLYIKKRSGRACYFFKKKDAVLWFFYFLYIYIIKKKF